MLSGCLIDDPPAYTEPRQTPPRLNTHDADPPLNQIIVANSGDRLQFTIGVSSEDAGEDVTAQLLLDYNGRDVPEVIAYQNLPASTIDDPNKRLFEIKWRVVRVAAGCHLFTLRASHLSNLPGNDQAPKNTADLAEVDWFAMVDTDAASSDMLVACPGLGPP